MSLEHVELTLVDSMEDVVTLLQWLGRRRPYHAIAVDTETSGLDRYSDHIRLCQVGDDAHGFAFAWDRWRGLFEDIVRRWDGGYILHNAPFDVGFFSHAGVELPRHRIDDTLVQARINEPHMPAALKSQATRHVDSAAASLQGELTCTKWTWATVPIDYQPYWAYAALDPVLAYHLHMHHHPIVMRDAPRSYEIEMPILWIVERMKENGAFVDVEFARRNLDRFTTYCREVADWCKSVYGVNPGSNDEVIQLLQSEGVTFEKRTKGGALSLDSDVLDDIDHPLAQAVLQRRKAQKMASTYLKFYVERSDADQLIHPSFNSLGARTGRMSSSDPNLQNLPRRGTNKFGDVIRNCIKTRYGDDWSIKADGDSVSQAFMNATDSARGSLIMCDYSQIEMRMMAHFARERGMIEAFKTEGDFFVNLARQIFQDDTITKKDKRRQITKNAGYACVPLSTEIFTQRGWLKHDEVLIGDRTLGYNFATQRTEWTEITHVVHYDDADVVSIANSHRAFEATPNHRWIADHERTHEQRFIETSECPRSEHRLVLAAECAEGGAFNITDQEAAILGWMLGDGGVFQGKFVGASSQGRDGHNVAARIYIDQVKPEWIHEIDGLLTDIPHKRYVAQRPTRSGLRAVSWILNPEWSRSLFQRVGLWQPELGARRISDLVNFDPWQFALSLSPGQRHIVVATLNAAEGGSKTGITMAQAKDSPVTELMIALGFLTGHYVTVVGPRETDIERSWTRKECVSVNFGQPHMTGQRVSVTRVHRQPVWCVTTELGSWTMRQGNTPVLTGNSIYGSGIRKFSQTAGIPEVQGREFMHRWNTMYSGLRAFQDYIINTALQRRAETGVSSANSPLTNRLLVTDAHTEYKLVNYVVQGAAAEVNKMKLIELDAAGLGDWMFGTVHDEVLFDVPGDHVIDVVHTVLDIMNDDALLDVPIEADASFGERWGEKTEWPK